MDWDAMGAIGEVLAAAGVIVTLVFLTAQIRANTKQARASMVLGLAESFNGSHSAVMENPQLAGVIAKRVAGEDLTPAERIQWASVVNRVANVYLSVQRAYDAGQIDRELFETYCRDVSTTMNQSGWGESLRQLLTNYPHEAKLEIFRGLYSDRGGRSA